jgi:hypothetical protein
MHSTPTIASPTADRTETWPRAAQQVLAALDSQFPPMQERRKIARHRFNVSASLQFGGTEGVDTPIYVRDVNSWAVGFLTPSRPASHAKATITIGTPDGQMLRARCLIRRCRAVEAGWFDCVLEFDLPQAAFSTEAIRRAA